MVPWLRHLLYKQEDRGLNPQSPLKARCNSAHLHSDAEVRDGGTGIPRSSWTNQSRVCSGSQETLSQEEQKANT